MLLQYIYGTNSYYRYRYDTGVRSFWSWLKFVHNLDIITLSSKWWSLNLDSRKAIGLKIINAYCKVLPGKLETRSNSMEPWRSMACLGRAILQCCLLGNMGRWSGLWLAQWNCWGEARSYFPYSPNEIKLPVTTVTIICEPKNFYHAVSALQINTDVTKLDSWVFFAGQGGIIKPDGSNSQIPHGSVVSVRSMDEKIINYGSPYSYGPVNDSSNITIAEFTIS